MGVPLAAGPWSVAEDTHLHLQGSTPGTGSGKLEPPMSRFASSGSPSVTLSVQMGGSQLREHLISPRGRGALTRAPHSGAAGGAACGDLVKVALRADDDRVAEAGFDASGCAAARAAGSAVVELVEGRPLLEAALVTPEHVASELGGLLPEARHAAELAADALHRALGSAARDGALGVAPSSRRTLVAMSGGVDSAAAAQLALDSGDDVVAVTLELWADPATDGERSCCSPQAVTGARALAHRMGIPHITLDLRERFRAEVVDRFLDGYAAGLTPNPCVRCNGEVRFDAMLDLATALGAARLATGHYARVARDRHGPLVRAAVDRRKDQSYMLAKLDPALLDRLSFPLGGLTKDAVRALLRRHGGPGMRRPGEIVDRDGRVLGRHDGQHEFTVGQRRGLGVHSPEPLYVVKRDAATNRVTVGTKRELATTTVRLDAARLHRPADQVRAVRLRYHAEPIPCRATAGEGDELRLELERPAHAVAPR